MNETNAEVINTIAEDAFHIIVPANNEQAYIGACLQALLDQKEPGPLRVIVAANACTDDTVSIVRALQQGFRDSGHDLHCLDLPQPGKLGALREAENLIPMAAARVYLDADIVCDPDLIKQVRDALTPSEPRYVTGTLVVARAKSWVTRQYARLWQKLPFVTGGAVGAGFFAVNGAGRARWGDFPDIISDDTFVRLQFEPSERIEVPACYHWPMIEGLWPLIRVRHRQDRGVHEISRLYPQIMQREKKAPFGLLAKLRLASRDPIGFGVYSTVAIAVRLRKSGSEWSRGR